MMTQDGTGYADSRIGDYSSTDTCQDVKQENTGSGYSTNFNCSQNLIEAGVEEQEY